MRIAVFGDVHGCIDELEELYLLLEHESLDSIYHLGDLVDRGPDSGAVVQYCRTKSISGVLGNHESVLLERKRRVDAGKKVIFNPEKDLTLGSIRDPEDWAYLESLGYLYVIDPLEVLLVHAGIYPSREIWQQPMEALCRIQLIHPNQPVGKSKWWDRDKDGVEESVYRAQGWVRWYEVCDDPYLVVYGHSVFERPHRFANTLGIDTGCVFGGALTAVILPDMKFVQVKSKRIYYKRRSV